MLHTTVRPAQAPRPILSPVARPLQPQIIRGVRARGLVKSFEAGISGCSARVRALNGADFDAQPGEVVGLIGDPGSGKSTLMLLAAGMLRCDAGNIIWYTDDGVAAKDLSSVEYLPAWRSGHALLSLKRALAAPPGLLLLDDTLSSLDSVSQREARVLVRELRDLSATIVIAARDLSVCASACTRVARMRGGTVAHQ